MQVVRRLDENRWRDFVNNHPQGSIFHTPEMYEVFTHTKGYCPELWATIGPDGNLLALFLPVYISIINGLLRRLTTRAVAYGSILYVPGIEGQEAVSRLLQSYNRVVGVRLLFTELRNVMDLSALQPVLNERGYLYENHLNFLIDLSRPLPELWKNIRTNARRNIQKAMKSGVEIEELSDPQSLPTIYALLKEVYKYLQVPLPDLSLFLQAVQILYPEGMLKILAAKVNGNYIGALTLLLYKGVVTYWYTGSPREYSSFRASDLLVWSALEIGQKNGFQIFDFGGGGKPEEEYGVRDFKAKYGGDLVNYGRNVFVHSPTKLKLSRAGYQLMRRIL